MLLLMSEKDANVYCLVCISLLIADEIRHEYGCLFSFLGWKERQSANPGFHMTDSFNRQDCMFQQAIEEFYLSIE